MTAPTRSSRSRDPAGHDVRQPNKVLSTRPNLGYVSKLIGF
jgi:hypothetical protein